MPSLDIVSRADYAELENAINNTRKTLAGRFDFRAAKYEITLDRKAKSIRIVAEDGSKMEALRETLYHAAVKRGLHAKTLRFGEPEPGPAGSVKRDVKINDGLEPETAKSIAKLVKESKLRVQASIQGEEVRLSGKQIDDLRAVMALLNNAGFDQPLQYINMKS